MRKTTIIATAGLLLFSGAVLARHCPMDMKKIDAALAANPSVTAEELAEVKRLRAEGEELHKAGKHPESEAALAQAMGILKIQ